MPWAEVAIDLPIGVFLILRDLIRDRIGVSFEDEARDLLSSKLIDRLQALELNTFLDYYYLLKYDARAGDEWGRLTDALSVQETYFWREMDQVRTLLEILIPQHVSAGRGPIRIWSAACATGEEPLTLAIALAEEGWFGRADIQIWASDASPSALEKARRAVYRERSFRAIPPNLREKYFTAAPEGLKASASLLAKITYSRANLLDATEIARLASASFIFCRNVFIYFSTKTVGRIVRDFANSMPDHGYLFVGVSESLVRAKTPFELLEVGGAFVYAKKSIESRIP